MHTREHGCKKSQGAAKGMMEREICASWQVRESPRHCRVKSYITPSP